MSFEITFSLAMLEERRNSEYVVREALTDPDMESLERARDILGDLDPAAPTVSRLIETLRLY